MNLPRQEERVRVIDMSTWPRREHFRAFNACANPYFSLTTNLDLTAFYQVVKQAGVSFTIAMTYAIARAANAVPELRQRIRGDTVVEHEVVHPSATILGDDDAFRFCLVDYCEEFQDFAGRAAAEIAYVRQHPILKDDPRRDDLLFLSPLPWVSFTGLVFPGHMHPAKSIPMFAWGKFFQEGEALMIPVALHVHHAVVDGVHVGRFYETLQAYFNQPRNP